MYNKIFTKILDSSVWLEPTPTRIVWITLLAAMDEEGFCSFAAIGNVAGRARVTVEEAKVALDSLAAPDSESSDQDNDGRRIERVPGGWVVLNAKKYKDIVSRANAQEKTRERVQRFRQKKECNGDVTGCNGYETIGNVPVLPSESNTKSSSQDLQLGVVSLPSTGGKCYGVTQSQIDHWRELFPAVDVMQCLRTMIAWLEANSTKKKTMRGMPKFITGWLSREQDRGGTRQAAPLLKPKKVYVAGNPNNPADWLAAQVREEF